jgi:hypothetical protein
LGYTSCDKWSQTCVRELRKRTEEEQKDSEFEANPGLHRENLPQKKRKGVGENM